MLQHSIILLVTNIKDKNTNFRFDHSKNDIFNGIPGGIGVYSRPQPHELEGQNNFINLWKKTC